MLAEAMNEIAPMPRSALFLAGKAFQRYRTAGGMRTSVLPDFSIGAHAAVEGGGRCSPATDAATAHISQRSL